MREWFSNLLSASFLYCCAQFYIIYIPHHNFTKLSPQFTAHYFSIHIIAENDYAMYEN